MLFYYRGRASAVMADKRGNADAMLLLQSLTVVLCVDAREKCTQEHAGSIIAEEIQQHWLAP